MTDLAAALADLLAADFAASSVLGSSVGWTEFDHLLDDLSAEAFEARGYEDEDPADVPIDVLRDFHDAIASSGVLPLGLAARAVLGTTAG
jgi:hypothetical protein